MAPNHYETAGDAEYNIGAYGSCAKGSSSQRPDIENPYEYDETTEIACGQLDSAEEKARQAAMHNAFYLFFANGYSALLMFLLHLISLESLFSIGLAVGLTTYAYNITDGSESFDGKAMNWVLLSFAVITPVLTLIRISFSRRDQALRHIAAIRSTCVELYIAHAKWRWEKGEAIINNDDRLDHADSALAELVGSCRAISRFLTLPCASRARHRITAFGQREAERTLDVACRLHVVMLQHLARLSDLCEVLKRQGLPPNEATRIRQWERMVAEHVEGLRMIKLYRTPQALRSFVRLFTMFLPPFYAPYYASLARALNSFRMAIAFSVITSLALTALFESMTQMEDPFLIQLSLDGVHVYQEMEVIMEEQLLAMRAAIFPTAPPIELSSGRRHPSMTRQSQIRILFE